MSDLLNQASLVMVPSGYKEDTVYSVVPSDGSGDLSFTRASNGTRINSAGLVEVCPWNLQTYSEQFTNAAWIKQNSGTTFTLTDNFTTAPNGTATACKYTWTAMDASGKYFSVYGSVSNDIGNLPVTFSVYMKGAVGGEKLYLYANGYESLTLVTLTTEWVRYSITFDTANSPIYCYIGGEFGAAGMTTLPAGTAYIWGGQLNIGSTAKPYFPTTDRLNVPRLTYQNGGGGCPSLLLEKQSTNIIPYSETFENWTTGFSALSPNSVTANYGISPDGTQNADRIQLTINASNTVSQIYQFPSSSVTTYTASVWLKSLSGTPTVAIVDSYNITGGYQLVTLTTEWVRHTVTFAASSGGIIPQFLLLYGTTSNSADFLAWGFQLESSSYPTSYIPTTSSSATRVADAASKTGISSLIGQTEGTAFVEIKTAIIDPAGQLILSIDDGTTSNRMEIFALGSGAVGFYIENGGSMQANEVSSFTVQNNMKLAFAYKQNDFVLYINGTQVGTDTSGTVPTCSAFRLQPNVSGSGFSVKSYAQAVFFKTRLTNAELASLTTI